MVIDVVKEGDILVVRRPPILQLLGKKLMWWS